MSGACMTPAELADELGRSIRWVYAQWRHLVVDEGMPPPLHGGATPLVWSRAQIYAWLDRPLTAKQRALATAHRAASDAIAGRGAREADQLAQDGARLDRQFLSK